MANRGRHAKKIDTVHWTFLAEAFTGFGAGAFAATALPAQHLPETLLRIRGEWAGNFDGALAGGNGVQLAGGLILVPEGTGTTVLWSPLTDGDAPWIWWDVFNLMYDEYVADVVQSSQVSSRSRVVDSKAMRKVRNTELQFVAEQATITGFVAGSVNVSIGARVLAGS